MALWPRPYVIVNNTPGKFWDAAIYYRAMQSIRAGLQIPTRWEWRRQYAAQAAERHAFTWVYSPVTLLALRAFNLPPVWLASVLLQGWLIARVMWDKCGL